MKPPVTTFAAYHKSHGAMPELVKQVPAQLKQMWRKFLTSGYINDISIPI